MSMIPRLGAMCVLLILTLGLIGITGVVYAQSDPAAPAQTDIGRPAWSQTASAHDQLERMQRPGAPVMVADIAPDALLDFESEVISLVNSERKANDPTCPNLTLHATLREVAYAHSKDMHDRNFFDHVNPDNEGPADRVNQTNYDWQALGENIAVGYSTPTAVMNAWMNSEGHRRNILNCNYLDIGVGYYYSADSEYTHYWTQLFGRQSNAQNPDPEPEPELVPVAFLPLAINVAPPEPETSLVNGDFEAGPGVGWGESSSALGNDAGIIIRESPNPSLLLPHLGRYLAWLGGMPSDVSILSQTVTLPAGAPKLEFFYLLFSSESDCSYDTGKIALVSGTTERVLSTFGLCEATERPQWTVVQLDLTPYAGQSWSLQFSVTTDDFLNSNYFLDDVRIVTNSQ